MKPGTQTDTKVRLKGKGIPSLRNQNIRGDHYVTLVVQVPDKLNEEQKELLRQFDLSCGDSLSAAATAGKQAASKAEKKGFGEKIKENIKDLFDDNK